MKQVTVYTGKSAALAMLNDAAMAQVGIDLSAYAPPFSPTGPTQKRSSGWVETIPGSGELSTPIGISGAPLACMLRLCTESREVDKETLGREVSSRIKASEDMLGRALNGPERAELRAEIEIEMLPYAPQHRQFVDVLVSPETGQVFVGAVATGVVDAVFNELRMLIKAVLPEEDAELRLFAPAQQEDLREMMRLIAYSEPDGTEHMRRIGVVHGENFHLRAKPGNPRRAVSAKNVSPNSVEVSSYLGDGMVFDQLGIGIFPAFTGTIWDDYTLRGIKWGDELKEQAADDAGEGGDSRSYLVATRMLQISVLAGFFLAVNNQLSGDEDESQPAEI